MASCSSLALREEPARAPRLRVAQARELVIGHDILHAEQLRVVIAHFSLMEGILVSNRERKLNIDP